MANAALAANHNAIISNVGLEPVSYPYYNAKTIDLDFDGYVKALEGATEGSVILVHGCAHNPTVSGASGVQGACRLTTNVQGVDPTAEQWQSLVELFLRKKHFAFFDSAYQGFATGDLDRDAQAVRLFAEKGVPMLVCQVGGAHSPTAWF